MTDDTFLRGSVRRLRSRSDRRASRRVGLAAVLLRLDFDIALTALLTGVPVSLVDLIQSELHPTPVGVDATPRRRRRRIVGTAVHLFVLACMGACVAAVAERAVLLSVAAGGAAMTAVAYRRRRVRTADRVGLPSAERPTNPRSAGRD